MPNIFLVLLIFFLTDCYFLKFSESKSLKGQNRPVCKRKKPAQNQPVRKRIKTDKLIEEASLGSLISDDEDSNFAAGSIRKKSKENKKGLKHFIFQQLWAFCPVLN